MTRKAETTKRKDESNHHHKSKHAGLRCIQTACSHRLIGRTLCERWVAVLGHDIASTVAKMYCPCQLAFPCTAVVNMGRWIHLLTVEATVDRCNRNGFKTLMVQRCFCFVIQRTITLSLLSSLLPPLFGGGHCHCEGNRCSSPTRHNHKTESRHSRISATATAIRRNPNPSDRIRKTYRLIDGCSTIAW